MVNADYGSGTTGFDAISMADGEFNEKISYNKDGAITALSRGDYAENLINGGVYNYYDNSHRLKSVNGMISDGGMDRSNVDNYQYDANGNIITDKALKMRIEYDYRNLPVKITRYNDTAMTSVKNVINYLYDADGKRVMKSRE